LGFSLDSDYFLTLKNAKNIVISSLNRNFVLSLHSEPTNIKRMRILKVVLFFVVSAVLVGCGTSHTVPITGRTQSLMVEDGQVLGLANQQYQEFMKSAKLSTNAANTAMVKRVGQNLANAVTSYMNANGLASEIANFNWTFNLVQDKQVNAWCMPGGLIVVYEGILPVTQDEASLAIVLGHEIAHAVARHSAEQMSTQIKQQQMLQIGAGLAGALGVGTNTTSLIGAVVANGFNFKNLSYSRNHESEADHMGLIFAAMAGYDPQTAVTFWQRMAAQSTNKPSEFLSDHPSDETRIRQIQGWMPEALKYYKSKGSTSQKTTTQKAPITTTKTFRVSSKKK
jgi:predicted Zn-dependent protease